MQKLQSGKLVLTLVLVRTYIYYVFSHIILSANNQSNYFRKWYEPFYMLFTAVSSDKLQYSRHRVRRKQRKHKTWDWVTFRGVLESASASLLCHWLTLALPLPCLYRPFTLPITQHMGQIEKYRFCQWRKSENKTMNFSKNWEVWLFLWIYKGK